MVVLKDIWAGKMTLEGIPFEVDLNGIRIHEYPNVGIKPDSIDHKYISQDNFEFGLGDTLVVKNSSYSMDSLSKDLGTLYFSKLENTMPGTGWRIGEKINNYSLNDLDGKEFDVLTNSNKEFVLLDFWGTWCVPCKKLTPDLKELHNNNSDLLDIIGIAVDRDIEDVRSYVRENGLDWQHAFLEMKDRDAPIRRELAIRAFPTFILLDSENNIVVRGNTASFEKIRMLIESKKQLP